MRDSCAVRLPSMRILRKTQRMQEWWIPTSITGSASDSEELAADSSDMAERVEVVRPTEFCWKSLVLFTLSPRRRSEPGALSEDIMGVLSSAGEEGACKHVLRDRIRAFTNELWL